MKKFSIEYNPYLSKCVFKKDGKILNENSKIGAKSSIRLQILLSEAANWKGLLNEIDVLCDDDEVEIDFKGRRIDFNDLKYAANLYTGKAKLTFKFDEIKKEMDIIGELDSIIKEIKRKNMPEFMKKNKDGKNVFDEYEEVKNGIFEVSVIATVSSGKSTLLNAILHKELLPSSNAACTAKITRIIDNDNMREYEAECYGEDNRTVVFPRTTVDLQKMTEYNQNKEVTFIDVEGNIPAVSSNNMRLCLRDTPGPNNSMEDKHKKLTESIIKRTNSVILYIMNATQLSINDDEEILNSIKNEMDKAGKMSRDKFIFVLNKCDELDEKKGETVEKYLEDARVYLDEKAKITDPIIIPTSARQALLIRKKREGNELTRLESKAYAPEDFVKESELHFEEYATLTPTIKEKLKREVDHYHENEDNWDMEALIHSGVPAVEETIREYIEKYAYPMKITDSIKNIQNTLAELGMKKRFEESIAKDDAKLEKVRQQISVAENKREQSKKVYETYKRKIHDFEFGSLNERDEVFKVEMQLQKMTQNYNDATNVDKLEADGMISSFLDELEKLQKDCENRLNREIDTQIFEKCNEMLNEYRKMVTDVLNDIQIEGYDFRKLSSFEKIQIDDINNIKKKNEHNRYRTETRWKDNPEREGFLGFFKFWKPKRISYSVPVKDGVDVNVKLAIVDIMGSFSTSIKENIQNLFNQSYKQIEEYKRVFISNIDNLDDEIRKNIQELKVVTREKDALRDKVEHDRELKQWIEDIEMQINTLLTF